MASLGDMVVRIVGDNSELDKSIDSSQKKIKSMTDIVSQGANDMAKSFKQLDGEIALWGKSTDLLKQKQEVLKKEMSRLISEGIDPTGKETEKLMNKYYALGNEIIALEKKQKNWKETLKESSTEASKIGGKLSLFVTAPLLAAGVAAVKSAGSIEMYTASFETMLGSAEKASALMEKIIDFAAITPFNTEQLADSTKMLIQYGVEASKVFDVTKQLGDVSGGMNDKFQSLVLAYSQMTSAGKVLSQDLRQMATAGFNPLNEISRVTGESMASLADRMDKGKISVLEVQNAFKTATSEGGRFFEGMIRGSKTLPGLLSTLGDDVGALGRSFVEDLMPFIKETVKGLSELAQYFTGLDKNTKQTILIIVGFTAILGPAISGVSALTGVIAGLNGVLVINPIVAVTAALVALGATAALVGNNIKNLQENQKTLNDILKGGTTGSFAKDLEIVNKEIANVNAQIGSSTGLFEGETDELEKQLVILQKVATQIGLKVQGQRTGRTLAIDDAKLSVDAAALAERRLKIEEQYKKNRELILQTLENEKTEYQKIEEQINKLQNTPWSKGELESDRLKTLEVLRNKQIALIKESSDEAFKIESENALALQQQGINLDLALVAQRKNKLAAIKEFNDLSKSSTQLQIEQIEKEKQAFINAGISEVDAAKWASQEILNLKLNQFTQILNTTGSFVSQLQSLYQMDTQNRLDAIDAQLSADLAANDRALQDALVKAGVADLTAVQSAQKQIETLKTKLLEAKTAEDKAKIEEEIREAKKTLTKVKIQEEFNTKKDQLEKDAALAAYKIEKEAFETNKKFSIVQALIDMASAIMQSAKSLPWPLNLIPIAAVTALGAKQISLIRDQVGPQPPALAEGGIIMPRNGGVNTIMAEAGQPEVAIPLDRLGEVLNTFNRSIDSGNNMTQLTVNIDSEPIFSKIFDATKSKRILISANAVVD